MIPAITPTATPTTTPTAAPTTAPTTTPTTATRTIATAADQLVVHIEVIPPDRPRAVRSRLLQHVALVQSRLCADLRIRRVAIVVEYHGRIPSARLHCLVHTAVESLHHRSEMVRGCPLGVVAILVDDDTPAEALAQQISRGVGLIPDGCAVLHWQDVCALGIRPAAYATRL